MQCIHKDGLENITVSKSQDIARRVEFRKNESQNVEIKTPNLTNIAWYFRGGGLGTKLNKSTARKVEMNLSIMKSILSGLSSFSIKI